MALSGGSRRGGTCDFAEWTTTFRGGPGERGLRGLAAGRRRCCQHTGPVTSPLSRSRLPDGGGQMQASVASQRRCPGVDRTGVEMASIVRLPAQIRSFSRIRPFGMLDWGELSQRRNRRQVLRRLSLLDLSSAKCLCVWLSVAGIYSTTLIFDVSRRSGPINALSKTNWLAAGVISRPRNVDYGERSENGFAGTFVLMVPVRPLRLRLHNGDYATESGMDGPQRCGVRI